MKTFAKTLIFTLLAVMLSGAAFAQKNIISGQVIDMSGKPLVGVTVMVEDSAVGTSTNRNGEFSIVAKPSDKLVFSYLGYADYTVPVGNQSRIVATLKDDAQVIEDIVVEVGYGRQSIKDVTGAATNVKLHDMLKAPTLTFDQSLQGRIAGVSVTSSDGQPGSEMEIVIRGANSLTQSNSPLYVVDGFPIEDFAAAAINPVDIESMVILKDASATAIYGSRAANGVIVIETKKGIEGKPTITYGTTMGIQQVTKKMEMMDAYDFVAYQLERSGTSAEDKYLNNLGRVLDDYHDVPTIDMQDRLFRNGMIQMHNLSLAGGTKDTKYSISGSYANQEGVIVASGYEKLQGRFAFTQQINSKLKLNLNVNYTQTTTTGQTASTTQTDSNQYASYMMYRCWAFRPVWLNGEFDEDELFDDEEGNISSATMNPIISAQNEYKVTGVNTFMSNAALYWQLTDNLRLTVRGGYTAKDTKAEEFNNEYTYRGYPTGNNNKGINGSWNYTGREEWMNENTLTWKKKINKHHSFDLLGGVTIQGTTTEKFGFNSIDLPNSDLGMSGLDDGTPYSTRAALSGNRLLSFLGRLNYNYRSRYLLTVSFRADGSSKFHPDNRWGYFPSAAFAWRISKEPWMRQFKNINDAKLSISYGQTGNNRVGDFVTYRSLALNDWYSFNNQTPGFVLAPNTIGNDQLTWETTTQIDLGYEMSLFNNKLNFRVDLYRKITDDLLLNAKIPFTSGYQTAYKNIGKISNEGLEFSFNTINVRTRNFMWTSDFNIAFNRSRVLELSDDQDHLLSSVSFTGDFNATNLYIASVGGPVASFYGMVWDGVYDLDDFNLVGDKYVLKDEVPSNGDPREQIQPGHIKYVDQNGDGIVNDQDMVVIGRGLPIHTGGFNNNFIYKGFTLNIFFQWNYGNDIMNANRIMFEGNYANKNINQFKSYTDHWTFENTDSENFGVGGQGPRGVYSTRTIEDGSFLRLKTVQLSYDLPRRVVARMGIDQFRIFVSGQNLYTWSNYSGLDPEVSTKHSALTPGYDYSAYARNKVFTAGINITF